MQIERASELNIRRNKWICRYVALSKPIAPLETHRETPIILLLLVWKAWMYWFL